MSNDYVKSIIRQELVREIIKEIKEYADSWSEDISAKNLKDNLFSGTYLDRKIEEVLKRYGL